MKYTLALIEEMSVVSKGNLIYSFLFIVQFWCYFHTIFSIKKTLNLSALKTYFLSLSKVLTPHIISNSKARIKANKLHFERKLKRNAEEIPKDVSILVINCTGPRLPSIENRFIYECIQKGWPPASSPARLHLIGVPLGQQISSWPALMAIPGFRLGYLRPEDAIPEQIEQHLCILFCHKS